MSDADMIPARELAAMEQRALAAEARYEGQKSALTKALGELREAEARAEAAERERDGFEDVLRRLTVDDCKEIAAHCPRCSGEGCSACCGGDASRGTGR